MSWPTLQDYNEAIQNPQLAFSDPDLRAGQPELNQLGLPRPIAGNFACVYKIEKGGQRWAARCFSSEVSDQQRRYEAISTYLKKVALPYTVQFSFLQKGIKVIGNHYPLLKMEWVQGEPLHSFVARSVSYPDTLLSLANVWLRMMADLKTANIAHGDLQHGNILVVGNTLRLIDYDGMYVPGLAGIQSNECGHRNYQLPSRTGWDYGTYLDNFAAWVIYVSLVSLSVHPELWNKFNGGDECLIFRKNDFLQPANSEILRYLNSSPNANVRSLVGLFTSLFELSPQDVPALDGNSQAPPVDLQSVQPSSPNWWDDHVEVNPSSKVPSADVKGNLETETVVVDPSWILDSWMEEKPVEKLQFQGLVRENRLILLSSMAFVALARFLVERPVSEMLVIVTGVLGLNLWLCYIRYKQDPNQGEFENFKMQSQAFLKQIREHQTIVDSLSAERSTLERKLAENEHGIATQKTRLATTLQANLSSVQLELNSQLQVIAQRRRAISASETNKLDSLQANIGPEILNLERQIFALNQQEMDETDHAKCTLHDELVRLENTIGCQLHDLVRRIAGLNQNEADEKDSQQLNLQQAHIQSHLRSHSILNSWIPGIGGAYKTRLYQSGFQTAADIDWSVRNVRGIGAARESALILWRQSLETKARMSLPKLSLQERSLIENKYRQTRQSCESDKQRLQTELNKQTGLAQMHFAKKLIAIQTKYLQTRQTYELARQQVKAKLDAQIASVQLYFSEARQSLTTEDTQLRSVSAQKRMEIQEAYDTEVGALDGKSVSAQKQMSTAISELSARLRAAQKQTFALRWKAAKCQKDGQRFSDLRFANYLRTIISL